MNTDWIAGRIRKNEYLLTSHAEVERIADCIEIRQIEEVLMNCLILEDYPDDPRGASCLVCGFCGRKPVHVVCGHNSDDWLVVISVYIPSLPKWENPQERGA